MAGSADSIELPDDLLAFAEERVRLGQYASVSEVASEALRLLRTREERREQVREELGGIFQGDGDGTYLEPSDEEFADAVHQRALRQAGK